MNVFLVPVGPARHVAYCEPAEGGVATSAGESRGWLAGLVRRFSEVMNAAEQSRLREDRGEGAAGGWMARTRAWALRWLADRIAEQRLLWQLRACDHATLFHPSDLCGDEALQLLRCELKRDRDRHGRWLVVDLLLFLGAGILTLVPGPNLIAYYFAFRVVGHYLSMRGARQGLERVTWTLGVSAELLDLRTALLLDPPARQSRLRDIATRLELPHLVTFVERMAFKGA